MSRTYTKEEVLAFLRSVSIMNLAAVRGDQPVATVLLFHVDDEFTFYFGTHSDSFKAEAIRQNPKVSLSIWEHRQIMVQANGLAEEILDPTEAGNALDAIVEATNNIPGFWPPVLRIEGKEYSVFKIKTTWLRALDLTSLHITEKELPFTYILDSEHA